MEVLINLDTLYLKLKNFFPNIVKKTQDEIKSIENKYHNQLLINSRSAGLFKINDTNYAGCHGDKVFNDKWF
jgi:hypothetical protein